MTQYAKIHAAVRAAFLVEVEPEDLAMPQFRELGSELVALRAAGDLAGWFGDAPMSASSDAEELTTLRAAVHRWHVARQALGLRQVARWEDSGSAKYAAASELEDATMALRKLDAQGTADEPVLVKP